ncbi:MAG: hypothetical protein AAFW89_01285 [Bacteroidota bacterium]
MHYWLLHIILVLCSFIKPGTSFTSNNHPDKKHHEHVVLVVSSKDIKETELNKNEILDIYTLKKQNWSNGTRIRVVDFKGNNHLRSTFYDYLDIRIPSIKRIWLKEQFTGKSLPPIIVKEVEDMLKIIRETPGTIGYIPADSLTSDLKVLERIE